jgi:hypothetical protein
MNLVPIRKKNTSNDIMLKHNREYQSYNEYLRILTITLDLYISYIQVFQSFNVGSNLSSYIKDGLHEKFEFSV